MKNQIFLILLCIIFFSCNKESTYEKNEEDIEDEVLSTYKDMFEAYAEGTDEFFDYYEDDFVRVTGKGEIKIGVDEPKKQFNEYLKGNSYEVISIDEPKMVTSSGQVVTIGGYEEYFVSNTTNDTTYNKGMYIGVWRKQADDTWKISMETWHAGLE